MTTPVHRLVAAGPQSNSVLHPLGGEEALASIPTGRDQYPPAFIRHSGIIRLGEHSGRLRLGYSRKELHLRRLLERFHGESVRWIPVSETLVARFLADHYARSAPDWAESRSIGDFDSALNHSPVTRLVDSMLLSATQHGVSDLHVDYTQQTGAVSVRRDGVMHRLFELEPGQAAAVLGRFKALAGMNSTDSSRPQDGRIDLTVNDVHYDLRLSVLPTRTGESLVARILRPDDERPELEGLGFSPTVTLFLSRLAAVPAGLVVLTGPTDSGKTTTVHALLRHCLAGSRKVITIEDPIEYTLPGAVQIQPRAERGFALGDTLRRVLRQNPDVLLIGETRDEETAALVLRAALTGHLVFTSVHAHDSRAALVRLTNMGVSREELRGVLVAVVAQRLLRRRCAACAGRRPSAGRTDVCPRCMGTGYRGRIPIAEILDPSRSLSGRDGRVEVEPWPTLRVAAEECITRGMTMADEVERVIGDR